MEVWVIKSQYKSYSYRDSVDRIDEILDPANSSYEELSEIPSDDKLTYDNGFYVYCSALFIDIRSSSSLTDEHYRPKLARLYRAYISEAVAVLRDNTTCRFIRIVGDSVSGIFSTRWKEHIDGVFSTAAELNSMMKILNHRLQKREIAAVRVGIGLDYGRALMIKAGHKGSGVKEVVWMGDVVNRASNLCGFGGKTMFDHPIMASSVFYSNLNEHNQSLLSWNSSRTCYHGNVINTLIEEFYQNEL